MTVDKILAMTPQKTKYYAEAMRRIKARERLEAMDSYSYPHIKDKSRSKKHREIYKAAYPEKFEERAVKTSDLELI